MFGLVSFALAARAPRLTRPPPAPSTPSPPARRAAPELLWGARCTERADIYSFGVVLWEIVTGERPVRGQLRDVRVPEECPPEARALMLECLETRPSRRPSALQLVERLRAMPDEASPVARRAAAGAKAREPSPPLP